jgi:hypothetical protein
VYGSVVAAAPTAIGRALAGQQYVLLDSAALATPSGSYLPISFGDTVGYVRTADVALSGLTG